MAKTLYFVATLMIIILSFFISCSNGHDDHPGDKKPVIKEPLKCLECDESITPDTCNITIHNHRTCALIVEGCYTEFHPDTKFPWKRGCFDESKYKTFQPFKGANNITKAIAKRCQRNGTRLEGADGYEMVTPTDGSKPHYICPCDWTNCNNCSYLMECENKMKPEPTDSDGAVGVTASLGIVFFMLWGCWNGIL